MSKSLAHSRLTGSGTDSQVDPSPETVSCGEIRRRQRFHRDENTETDERDAGLKPLYSRDRGQLGICVDIYSATPSNTRIVGSYLYFLQDLLEKMFLQLRKRHLYAIKGHFLRQCHFAGVIIESIVPGVVILVSFDDVEHLDQLWKDFEDGSLGKVMETLFQLPDLDIRNFDRLESVEIRTRIFGDEVEKCRRELHSGIPLKTLTDRPFDVCTLKVIRNQQRIISGRLLTLKEKLRMLDQHLSEFILAYRQMVSADVFRTRSLAEFEGRVKMVEQLPENRLNLVHLTHHLSLIQNIREVLKTFEEEIYHPLSQIHSDCESVNQREAKMRIGKTLEIAQKQLSKDFDLTNLSHPSVKGKILPREEGLVMGLLSVANLTFESLEAVDNDVDEYFSAPLIQIVLLQQLNLM